MITLLLLASLSSGSSSGGATYTHPFAPTAQARLQYVVKQCQHNIKTPGLLAAVWSPQGNWVSATGVSDLATKAPMAADMQYKIGSQTKSFIAVLILQLVGEGKVSLGEHIDWWVRGVPNGNQITIAELLDHTSGLGDTSALGSSEIFDCWRPEEASVPSQRSARGKTRGSSKSRRRSCARRRGRGSRSSGRPIR